jgi:hypothetical protein
MVPFKEIVLEQLTLKDKFLSSIPFVDEDENSRKDSNLGPMGYNGDSNHYISFFL